VAAQALTSEVGRRSGATVPILLYHSISDSPSSYAREFSVSPVAFVQQLDRIVSAGVTPLTVSGLVDALAGREPMPERPIAITFDDGYADFAEVALDALTGRNLTATLYVTTGFLTGRPELAVQRPFEDLMLSWSQLGGIAARGVEIGAHSHGHPELDTLPERECRREIAVSKELLETELGAPVKSLAYPHGYSSARVRELVRDVGYASACAVKNRLSFHGDDLFALARLSVRVDTSLEQFGRWIEGTGARRASTEESLMVRAWRLWRRRPWRR
jgi:peptidoglycan/xylan/chitin deacetylase (PgdA/CDA1 family)